VILPRTLYNSKILLVVSGVRTRPSASAQGSRPKDFVEFCEIQTDEGATLAMLLSVQSIHKPSGEFKLGCTIAIQVAIRRYQAASAQTGARMRSLASGAIFPPSENKAWRCWPPSKPLPPVSLSTQTSPEQSPYEDLCCDAHASSTRASR
jgi:hypothetical protein